MSRRRLLLIKMFLVLNVPGVGAAQDAPLVTPADSSVSPAESTVGGPVAPGLFPAGTWVSVRPGARLEYGDNDLGASAVPVIYHVHKVEPSSPQPRYWLEGDVSGWAREADLLGPEDTLCALAERIRQGPCDPALYLARGLVEMGIGRYLPAIADFDDVLRLDPNCASAYYHRAIANGELSQVDRAIGDLYEAIRLEPDNPDYYFARAVVKERRHYWLEAIEDYTNALRLDPGNEHAKACLDRLARQNQSGASTGDGSGAAAPAAPAAGTTATPAAGATATPAADGKKTTESTPPPKTPLQVALEQAAIEEANARAAEARARLEEMRARIEKARARAEKALLEAEQFRRQRTQAPTPASTETEPSKTEPSKTVTPKPPKPEPPTSATQPGTEKPAEKYPAKAGDNKATGPGSPAGG